MPHIKFLPADIIIEVPGATLISDAARLAGIMIDLPCGGKGTCGKCLVQVQEGAVEKKSVQQLTEEEKAAGYVYACHSSVFENVTIKIPDQDEKQKVSILDDSIDLTCDYLPTIAQPSPLTKQLALQIPRPQKEDGLSDLDRLTREMKAATGIENIHYPLSIIRKLADTVRSDNGLITVTFSIDANKSSMIDIRSGHDENNLLGVAIDLGTTTISVQLIDLDCGKILSTKNGYNEQIHCGLDVISRINYASEPERLKDLTSKAVSSINRLISEAAAAACVLNENITCAHISGNTVMIHLLLGVKPEYIRLEPYTPTVLQVPPGSAGELGIAIHPDAIINISPGVGSYVGGDITAGIICTDLAQNKNDICLFLDVGTNGEMVIGNKDFLISCACSAGPAFEGGGIDCGMRATSGAINSVNVDRATGEARFTIIADGAPLGICGSGMIDLVAQLFITGWLDASGKLNRSKPNPLIRIDGRRAFYTLAPADSMAFGKAIIISENDIDNLLRAKAAIYSAASVLLKQIGIGFNDLSRFYVAGGFGKFLNLENAIIIGLLPDIPLDKFQYIGNSSLAGSNLLLLSQECRDMQAALTKRMTYIDLSNFPGFMDEYIAALFLPHTEISYFPRIRKML